jgi:TetR/AcrR family transcriptional regulator, cholesterol catabolism regulator
MKSAPSDMGFDRKLDRDVRFDLILKVAADCFNQRGISGTSLKDVASALGVTDAALYYYVKNKEELVFLCYSRALDIGEEALDRAEREGSAPVEKISLYIRYQIESVCGQAGPVAMLSEIPSLTPKHRARILERSRTHSKRMRKLVEQGVKCGELEATDAALVCNVILGAVNWIPKWFKRDGEKQGPEIAKSFAATLTAGLIKRQSGT